MPVHGAAEPVQHVPGGAVRGDVVVDRAAAAEGEAALVGLRRRLRGGVAGVARRLGAAVGVPVRGRRGRVGPRALRRGARARGGAVAAAGLLVAARAAPRRRCACARPLQAPVGLVRLRRGRHGAPL